VPVPFSAISLLQVVHLKIVHIHRRPLPTQFSIEGYFSRVREFLPTDVTVEAHVVPCLSQGVLARLRNGLSAWKTQGDVWHVTGDIHYVALFLSRKQTVLTVHDCEILDRLSGWRRALVKLFWFTLPVHHAMRLTVNSQTTKRRLLQEVRIPADRIEVIPVSVSPSFQPHSKPFNVDCPTILQVGTKANKNVERLVRALQGIRCRLEIVGPVVDSLRKLLGDCRVDFQVFGRLTDEELVTRYQEADIISFVSTHEGFGMPIVEAQCVERVCVTSNCSSMPEVAGEGACLVDPFSVESIRDGFLKVIADSGYREVLIEEGRKNRRRFDAQRIADQFLEVYRGVG
jgi:glycosyltransferase involved in cell wall biosynthesis